MIVQELVSVLRYQLHRESFHQIHTALRSVKAAIEETGIAMQVYLGIGAAVAGAGLVALTVHTGIATDKMADLAEKLGLTVQQLQELGYAAKQSDLTIEQIEVGFKQFSRNLGDAANGAAPKILQRFQQMNVALREGAKIRHPLDVLLDLAEAFRNRPGPENEALKMAVALKLFGRTGEEFMQLLNRGRPGIEKLMADFREIGGVITPQMREESSKLHAAWDMMLTAFSGFLRALVGPLMPQVTALLKSMTAAVIAVRRTLEGANDALTKLKFLVVWLTAFWLLRWLYYLPSVTMAIKTGLVGALSSLVSWLRALSMETLLFQLRTFALVAALAALAAIVALVANDLYVFATGGDSAFGRLMFWFKRRDWEDSPFVEAIKATMNYLTDLADPKGLERFKAAWSRLWEQMRPTMVEVGQWIGEGFLQSVGKWLFGDKGYRAIEATGKMLPRPDDPNAIDASRQWWGNVEQGDWKRALFGNKPVDAFNYMFGGAAAPAATARAPGPGAAPNMSMSLTVNVPPGSDGKAIGEEVMSHIEDNMSRLHAAYAGAH